VPTSISATSSSKESRRSPAPARPRRNPKGGQRRTISAL
jgi:hypothetical protein